jgi:cytochrome c oxidase subunit 2
MDVPAGKQTYYGQCNQICGVNHAFMPIEIKALPKAEYAAWLTEAKEKFAAAAPAPSSLKLASAN